MADVDEGHKFIAAQYHDFRETEFVHKSLMERVQGHMKGVNDKIIELNGDSTMPEADRTALIARWMAMRTVIRGNFGGVS